MTDAETRREMALIEERARISEATGFDAGDRFEDEAQVREYFTVAAWESMNDEKCPFTQDDLDAMAAAVIEHRWHMPVTVYAWGCGRVRSALLRDAEASEAAGQAALAQGWDSSRDDAWAVELGATVETVDRATRGDDAVEGWAVAEAR